MLKKHSQFFIFILGACDLLMTLLAWSGAYFVRKNEFFLPLQQGLPEFPFYLQSWPLIASICLITFVEMGLYQPRRDKSLLDEFWGIALANFVCWLLISTLFHYYARTYFSRFILITFIFLNTFGIFTARLLIRYPLRFLRRRGFNQRAAIIVGSGRIGQKIAEKIKKNSWMGIHLLGFFDSRKEREGKNYAGLPVFGTPQEIPKFLETHHVDHVFIAMPMNQNREIEEVLGMLSEETLDVRIVPDTLSFMTMHHTISNLDGLPIISLTESPLYGWRRLGKRIFDIFFSLLVLILATPFFLVISLLIKITSPGPVFYRQVRMGLDGKLFYIIKFRSMRPDAEKETGAVWAKKEDPRTTWIGKILRKTSLDELPQFWNVFLGEMSVVGPRPERPELIQEFKKIYRHRRYMHRHKMKAGITGLAQINGWRGDGHPRALVKRLQYDLKYIREWSLWLDFKIILKTPYALLKGDHPQN